MDSRERVVRVAAAQFAPVWLDRDATTEKAVRIIRDASAGGAELVAFPEAWIPGAPYWIWLGSPMWGMPFCLELMHNAVEFPSATVATLQQAARDHRVHVVMGLHERDGGTLYCTQLFLDDRGQIMGKRRKLKPTHGERAIWGQGDGSDLRVFDTPLGKLGGLNCWEHIHPLTRCAMYAMGEQIHVGSWPAFAINDEIAPALGADANLALSRAHALEGQSFVLHVNAVNDARTVERLADTDEKRALLGEGGGHTHIFGPDGTVLAKASDPRKEELVFADLPMVMIDAAKLVADPIGHYGRPDVLQLRIDRTARPVAQFTSEIEQGVPAPLVVEDAGEMDIEPAHD